MSNTISIKTYQFRHEAEFALGIIESNGIKAYISGDDYGGAGPHILLATGGAKLMVLEEEATKALELLDEYDSQ